MLLNQTHLKFGEIADRWAQESAGHPAALERDKILARIVVGLLNDEFNYAELTIWRTVKRGIDGNGNYVVQYKGLRPVTRDMLNHLLFHDAPDNYNKQILEELRISKKAFGQWCDDQEFSRPAFWFDDKSSKVRPRSNRQERKHAKRRCDAEEEAVLKNQINAVLAKARREWPDREKFPGIKPAAKELVRKHRGNLNYKFSTVCKILDGTYPASRRLDILGIYNSPGY